MSINSWMGKQIVVYPYNGPLLRNQNKLLISTKWMNLKIIILGERSQTKTEDMLYDSIYKKL